MKLLLIILSFISTAQADTYVKGHFRSNGSYVQPHFRSNADSFKSNNYSNYGNTNPYNGNTGTKQEYNSWGSQENQSDLGAE